LGQFRVGDDKTHLGERHYSTGKVTVVPYIRLCEELGLP